MSQPNVQANTGFEKATFAGGCFWCMEPPFEKLDGVISVTSGYTGGHKENPTYEEVSSGNTGHVEAVRIIYDSSKITYRELLDVFWRQIDPTDAGGQFADRGMQYKNNTYKKPSDEELKAKLTPLEYKVTQQCGTEPAFQNKYWDNKREGIYVDAVSGEPLFSSLDKFASGTGWPSFTKPLEQDNIVEKEDKGFFMKRTEVRSKNADSHLGHVFTDGPDSTGLRYCINSAALRFIQKEDLEKEGYAEYKKLWIK